MGTLSKTLLAVSTAGLSCCILGGCIYVTPVPQQQEYVSRDPAPISVVDNTPPAPVQPVVAYQPPPTEVVVLYQDDLSPYGRWIMHPHYGRVWLPTNPGNGWQPYTVGHWVYTSDGNCVWVSDGSEAQWGPTVYHYGQWALTPDWGWVWVPGTVWAPAWVAWRDGDGYCGWAPLPPECADRDVITFRQVDDYCPPERYVYVSEADVTVVNVNQHLVRNNVTVINNTRNITNITVVNNRVQNTGVPIGNVEERSGRAVDRVQLANASTPAQARDLAKSGQPVRYSTPQIQRLQERQPAPVHAASAAQVQASQQRQAQLNNELDHQQQTNHTIQQKLNNQTGENKNLQLQDQAARQQQTELDQQIKQQKQEDAGKQTELKKAENTGKALDRDTRAEADRQAKQQQAQAARQAEAEKKRADAQAAEESKRQAAADREEKEAAEKQAERDRQKAADAEKNNPHPGKQSPDKPKPEKPIQPPQ